MVYVDPLSIRINKPNVKNEFNHPQCAFSVVNFKGVIGNELKHPYVMYSVHNNCQEGSRSSVISM